MEILLVLNKVHYIKQINQDKKQLVFAPASLNLTNSFTPLSNVLAVLEYF